ncbi:MAG: histidine kinase [Saprospiraceae bacterium]|nr:histidine kinase [Saprospiraceae bacterium]
MKLRKWHFLILFVTVSGYQPAYSQQVTFSLPYDHYTVANGLAQMQVRDIYADPNGLVWIATQGGLSVYDGTSMRTVQNLGPLAEQYIVNVFPGRNHLWLATHTGLYAYDGSEVTTSFSNTPSYLPYTCFEDGNGYVWVSNDSTVAKVMNAKGDIQLLSSIYPSLPNKHFVMYWGHPNSEYCYLIDAAHRFYSLNLKDGTASIDSTTFEVNDNLIYGRKSVKNQENFYIMRSPTDSHDQPLTPDIFFPAGMKLLLASNNHIDSNEHAVNSFLAPLVFFKTNSDDTQTLYIRHDSIYLPLVHTNYNVLRFWEETQHRIFVATDEGLFIIHGDGIANVIFPECDYPWSVVPGALEELYLGCYRSGVWHIGQNGNVLQHAKVPAAIDPNLLGDQILTNYFSTPDKIYWGSNGGFMALDKKSGQLKLIPIHSSIEAIAREPRTGDIIAGGTKLYWLSGDDYSLKDSLELPVDILAGAFVNDLLATGNYLWVAAPGGIVRLDIRTKQIDATYTLADSTLSCLGAVVLETDDQENIWAGGTCGLLVRRNYENRFSPVLPGVISERVNQITLLPEQRLACASNNNLYLLGIQNQTPELLTVYNSNNGLNLFEPSENGSSLSENRYVWMPSVSGIQRLDLRQAPDTLFPAWIMLVSVNDMPVRLIYNQTDTIHITGQAALLNLSLIEYSGRTWRFRFQMNDKSWSPWQTSTELLVSGMKHGINSILVQATWDTQDPKSIIEKIFRIKATLPLFQRTSTHWTIIGLLLISIGCALYIYLRSRKSALREKKLKEDLYRNRLRMIQSYLNPHFLFNTLTRIQDRILHHDAQKGNDLIIRMARVFRKILDTGKSAEEPIPLIRLSDELSFVEDMIYLHNEQLTVPVQYRLEVDSDLMQMNPSIPPLLIQSFVENAFKHAFQEKEGEKLVHVTIAATEGMMEVHILDNGIGYPSTSKDKNKESLGTMLAFERMEILNQLKIKNSISIQNAEPHGTHVIIKIKLL